MTHVTGTRAPHPDVRIDELAAAQHGVVSRAQLLEGGLSKGVVDRRVAGGRLKVLHRGVYQVGPLVGTRARELAAVLACGASAMVSHCSAGAAWQFMTLASPVDPVEVIVAGAIRRRMSGVRAHRARSILPDEVVRLDGVPITSPGRTRLDVANRVGAAELERAVAQAERLELVTVEDSLSMVNSHGRHPGAAALRRLLQSGSSPALTRSDAEAMLLELIRKARLRAPRTNARILSYEVDFLWPDEKLIVEVDGYTYHSTPAAFARDRRRDATLMKAGYRVLRFTWRDIVDDPIATIATIAHELARVVK